MERRKNLKECSFRPSRLINQIEQTFSSIFLQENHRWSFEFIRENKNLVNWEEFAETTLSFLGFEEKALEDLEDIWYVKKFAHFAWKIQSK